MSPRRGATSGASIHTDPERARRVIESSRQDFDTRYPDVKLSPVVGLICAYEEEDNIGAVLAAMPAEACGLAVTTLVVVDAWRVLMRNGPQGGNIDDARDMHTVIATVDQVAADSFGCTLIGQKRENMAYLAMGEARGLGTTRWENLRVKEV